jgi:hypothetical protein
MTPIIALVLAAAAVPAPELLAQRYRGDVRSFLTRGVFAEGRLWVRSAGGAVYSLAPGDTAVRIEPLPEDALDLCTVEGKVVALTASAKAWTVRRHDASGWTDWTSFTVRAIPEPEQARGTRNRYLGVACGREEVTVAFSEQLVVVRKPGARVVRLSTSLAWHPMISTATVLTRGRELLVGLNRGEWGGQLWRVDPRSGSVVKVAGIDEPVHAISLIPGRPGCAAVAAGMMHFDMTTGALYEVCGGDVMPLVRRRLKAGAQGNERNEVTFVGVGRVGDRLVGAGLDGLYTVRGDKVTHEPYPKLKSLDGLEVSFDLPGIALVVTEMNRTHAMAWGVPMLVVRE